MRRRAAERALILSQPWPGHHTHTHTHTHSIMLRLSIREGNLREILSTLVRLAAAGLYPSGSTGRAPPG
ncbi:MULTISPECIES: DUF3703 domain-containing protein [unclassified Streptomyces]|uniref:DUF3703 domain-containing protein n=1 Tax=unclassified Streptomyces TaxID=2593676 RepID=UPI00381E032A